MNNKNKTPKGVGLEVSVQFDAQSVATYDELANSLLECIYEANRSKCTSVFRIDYSECETIYCEIVTDGEKACVSAHDCAWGQPDEHIYYRELQLSSAANLAYCLELIGRFYHKIASSLIAEYDRNGNPITFKREVIWNDEV